MSELSLVAAHCAVAASNNPFTAVLSHVALASAQARAGQLQPAIVVLQHIAAQLEIHGMRAFKRSSKRLRS